MNRFHAGLVRLERPNNKYGRRYSEIVREKVKAFRKSIAASKLERKIADESTQLYDILIAPIAPFLYSNKQLCVVPDKSLYQLPFAALVSPSSERFLTEDYTVFTAPSATMPILSSEAAAQNFTGREEKLLAIGNPHFNRQEFPDLQDLPDAEKEIVKIAANYQNAKILVGTAADKKNVLSEIPQNNIYHFDMKISHFAIV